jgi:F0F1-type ATP synthase assembly protein I
MTDISMRNYDNRYSGMDEIGSWAIGGTTMIGIGIGFVFLHASPLLFTASVMVGIGSGLLIAVRMAGRTA